MYQIAVCDDEQYSRSHTMQCLMEYAMQHDLEYRLDEFSSGEALLERNKEYDLIFMDYDFKDSGDNGMDISRVYRQRYEDSTIIFLSSYESIVFESFSVNAFRFLVKPLKKETFIEAMDSFVKKKASNRILMIKTDGTYTPIYQRQILYCEAMGKYCVIHTTKGEIECHETLASIEGQLSDNDFFRIHKSYLVHLAYVQSFERYEVVLQNQGALPISRTKYKSFVQKMGEFMC